MIHAPKDKFKLAIEEISGKYKPMTYKLKINGISFLNVHLFYLQNLPGLMVIVVLQ